MPKRTDLKKIMIIGSGPIVIGQAAEFDYAGTQACLSLKEEGYEVILVNSNPATIMTDTSVADKVYMEPLTLEYVARILRKERPDAIVPGIGGQTGLNLAMQLEQKGVLKECQVELLGTDSDSIRRAEDREQFKELCQSIGEPVIPSQITYNLEEAKAAAAAIGYPVVLRPAFTLGGTGGGFADDEAQLVELGMQAFKLSPIHQVLIEKSVKGYKEIEFEVMRDASDRAITICGMENIDPVGVHTGDSAVVAPIMTLSDHDMKMLNDSAIKIIRTLKIQGGCNVQFALNPKTSEYFLIEINPRVSRSSALASKASGYPIARVTAKVAVGMNLDEIAVANTTAAFEPSLDYVVAKLPRFPFDKFSTAANTLGTQMKATGEVMGIGSTLEECLLKSVRSLEIGAQHLWLPKFQNMTKAELTEYLRQFRDDGLFAVAQLLRLGASVDEVAALTMITPFFLETIRGIVDMEQTLCAHKGDGETLKQAKQMGFCDPYIARLWGVREEDVYAQRVQLGLYPAYKMVDTSHTGAYIPYFYSTYAPGAKSEARRSDKNYFMDSPAINIEMGHRILTANKNLSVDVKKPQHTMNVEIRDMAYLYVKVIPAVGGMPVGTNGRATLLLSGGIDSPVAGWMIAKRGVHINAVHFHSYPYTSDRAKEKVLDLAHILSESCCGIRVHIVPFTKIQMEIHEKCPEEYTTLIMRRFMMRIAEKVARQENSEALITGESVGQVASQTMTALGTTDMVVDMPVFRPLIGFDKEEIIAVSEKIGTFETSSLPYEDCCTVFTPRHPATHPKMEKILEGESKLDIDGLIDEAIAGIEIVCC